MSKSSSSSSSAKGKDAASDVAALEAEWRGEWRSLTVAQQRRVMGAEACVSFHPVVGHPLYPRLAILRFLPSADADRVVLVRDSTSVELLKEDLKSALHWRSLLFYSNDPDVKEAVVEMMTTHRKAMAWSWLDDDVWRAPAWPTMMGVSPWRPNRVVELFRKNVTELLSEVGADDNPEAAPPFDSLEVMFLDIVRAVERTEVWDEATGALFPQRAVFVPPSFFGARVKSSSEREREERREMAAKSKSLEVELVEDGVLEGPKPGVSAGGGVEEEVPARAEASAATPGPTAGGEEEGDEEASARRQRRSVHRREKRARRAEERQREVEAEQRVEAAKKEEEEEARAERLLAAARRRYEKDQARILRKAEERKRKGDGQPQQQQQLQQQQQQQQQQQPQQQQREH